MLLLPFFLFASLAQAEFLNSTVDGVPATYFNIFGPSTRNKSYTRIISASTTPNISSSVAIDNWRWQINVTEVAVPNSFDNSSRTNFSEGYHVTNAAWGLTIDGEDVRSYLNRTKLEAYSIIYGGQVNKLYSTNNTCAAFLGDECASAARSSLVGSTNFILGRFFNLRECNNSVIGEIGQTQFNLGFAINTSYTGPVVDRISGAYAGTNTVVYQNATSQFNLFGVAFSRGNSTGTVPQPLLFCQSVNITAIKTGGAARVGLSLWAVLLTLAALFIVT